MVRPNREPLSGEVEIDESYVGGPEPGKPGRAAEDKAIVAAAVEKRGKSCGRVRLGVIANVSADVLTAFVDTHLGDGETAHTDGRRGYAQLGNTGYRRSIIPRPRSSPAFISSSRCSSHRSSAPISGR